MQIQLTKIIIITGIEPVVLKFPDHTHVVEGQTVEFHVRVSGSPLPKLTWYQNGEEVVTDYSIELAEDGSLTLPSAEIRHGGVYQLVANSTAGRVEREVQLHVTVEAEESQATGSQSEVEFQAIPASLFGNHVESYHANSNDGFNKEYKVRLSLKVFLVIKNTNVPSFFTMSIYMFI